MPVVVSPVLKEAYTMSSRGVAATGLMNDAHPPDVITDEIRDGGRCVRAAALVFAAITNLREVERRQRLDLAGRTAMSLAA